MNESSNPELDTFSYDINNGIMNFRKSEDLLYWIPPNTINRPKENT